jgi:predicted alpha/beta hydrolase
MSPKRYFIVQHDNDWMIKFDDDEFGPYRSQSEAMLFAVDAARKLTERGKSAEVCLMGENGFFRAEWSGGQECHAA